MNEAFLFRDVPALKKRVFRYGLSASYGLDDASLREALEGPVNYLFWTPRKRFVTQAIKDIVIKNRERYLLATGPLLGFFAGSIRKAVENALRSTGCEYLDVLQVFWAGRMSALTRSTVGEMVRLRDEGKVHSIGISIHDRKRAGRLAEEGPLDFFMIRYNAAHPGAEADIFPRLEKRRPAIVAYTATSHRKLLKAPRGFSGRAASAGDCYRFCLTSSHVDVVLSAPSTREQLRENLAAIDKGPLSDDEMTWMRQLGRAVHG